MGDGLGRLYEKLLNDRSTRTELRDAVLGGPPVEMNEIFGIT